MVEALAALDEDDADPLEDDDALEDDELDEDEIMTQVTPSPSKPMLHAQVNAPGTLVHVAFTSQSSVPSVHSSTSVQVESGVSAETVTHV